MATRVPASAELASAIGETDNLRAFKKVRLRSDTISESLGWAIIKEDTPAFIYAKCIETIVKTRRPRTSSSRMLAAR